MSKNDIKWKWPKACIWPEPLTEKSFGVEREGLNDSLNTLKLNIVDQKSDPVIFVSRIINYRFINENLLRQAFTRRAFQIEYGLSGSNEELEFIGDSALSMVVTREMVEQFSTIDKYETDAPFRSRMDEGDYSRIKSHFVCKEHLAERCRQLGLEKFILFGSGEEHTESASEDVIEALIGAVAVDCGWDMNVLTEVVDRLLNLQFAQVDRYLKKSYYEIFNSWHQKHFGSLPKYEVYRNRNRWYASIRFFVPENEKGIQTSQRMDCDGNTRSEARNMAAELARGFVIANGLWVNIKNAGIVPNLENSINQLQQMFQQKYIEGLEYDIQLTTYQEKKMWECVASANGQYAVGIHVSKVMAKKKAAFSLLVKILEGAGLCRKEWKNQMYHLTAPENPKELPGNKKKAQSGLKYTAVAEILKSIPAGKVITEKVLIEYLRKYYGMETLDINYAEFPRVALREKDIPFHRFLTAKGLLDKAYKEKAEAEGHILTETKTANYRVLDYKEAMADLSKIEMPAAEDAIGPCGSFLENVNVGARECEELEDGKL